MEKKIPERSRSILGRFYCINVWNMLSTNKWNKIASNIKLVFYSSTAYTALTIKFLAQVFLKTNCTVIMNWLIYCDYIMNTYSHSQILHYILLWCLKSSLYVWIQQWTSNETAEGINHFSDHESYHWEMKGIQGVSQKSWNIFFLKRFIDNTG